MSVIKATVTISMFIIVLVSNTAYGQNEQNFFYNNRKWERNGSRRDDFVFPKDHIPDAADDDATNYNSLNSKNSIPLEFLKQLDNVTDVSEFLDKFVSKDSIDPKDGIANRFGNVERGAGIVAKSAGCIPDSTVVPLEPLNPSSDPLTTYYPRCTRVKRCSGCCSSPLLSCQPVETETLTFTVIKVQYDSSGQVKLKGKEPVVVEQHSKCLCDCRIKKEHCNAYQIYDRSQCICICTNYDEQRKCLSQADKIWDYNNCTCQCRNAQQCTSGTYFNNHSCECVAERSSTEVHGLRLNSTPSILDRKRFIVKAVPVEPDNSTRYDTQV